MATTGTGGSGERKDRLMMRGGRLVTVGGRLILGPCDVSGGGGMPMSQTLCISFEGKLYKSFAKYMSGDGGYARENNPYSPSFTREFSGITMVQGFVDGLNAGFGVLFSKWRKVGESHWNSTAANSFDVCGCVAEWPDGGELMITKRLSFGDYTYYGTDIPVLAAYDGPVCDFVVVQYRMGTLHTNKDGSIYFDE